jgi:hypothetical protein
MGALCLPSITLAFTPPTYSVDGSTSATQALVTTKSLGAVQLLGQGFDIDRDVGRETCLNGSTITAGISTATLDVQQITNRDILASELNISLSGSYGSGPGALKTQVQHLKDIMLHGKKRHAGEH